MNSTIASIFQQADCFIPLANPPRIGISVNRKDGQSCVNELYVRSVLAAGGAPILIPAMLDPEAMHRIVADLDGLLFSGGGDINPILLGEEPIPQLQDVDPFRDEYDLLLLRIAFIRQIPIMGVCRGHQLVNAAFGGTLLQDIYAQHSQPAIKHSQEMERQYPSHSVGIVRGTRLHSVLKSDKINVNSIHHQAVKAPAQGFVVSATAPDGIIEAIEHPEYSVFGLQWHPEGMAANGDEASIELFRMLVKDAQRFAEAKSLHRSMPTIDLHTDSPMAYDGDFNLGHRIGGRFVPPFTESKVNLPLMEAGLIDAAFMAAYIPQAERTAEGYDCAWTYAVNRLQCLLKQEALNPDRVGIARTPVDLLRLKRDGKRAIFLGLENGYAIGKDIARLDTLRRMGVSYITLCHNGANDICDSAIGQEEWNGLSPFGCEVVKEMNRLGIIVDVSHASEPTVYGAIEASRAPIIASHSSARALCKHPRNLGDDQIRAIASQGGIICICLYSGFISKDAEEATLSEAIAHINHIAALVGTDHIGIGSDFDGGGQLIGCRASNELINITIRLLREGYSHDDIRKIWSGNILRVMESVQAATS
ncbi:MAG: gamma-glutamyl-gamma-aminobutyrate hydrolase family protein [Tannerellaceae bacterium]|jgi:microsomal dipeptidase-like Zn-dependent dipeptidase/gamma-glutamyl-gamma-aminobutyrate hydrolase PuuD|nr:gamma-glutamyl-gamma-aminobutyrate hydrolase family protein [Tannerellaceae bacterium]